MKVVHFNVDKPEDLKRVTENGLIWNTPYVQKGLDAITSGAVKLADCKNMPADIRQLVESK